jgi:hypothetical protein
MGELASDQFIETFVAACEPRVNEAHQTEIPAASKAMRASVIAGFRPNPAYGYRLKPF